MPIKAVRLATTPGIDMNKCLEDLKKEYRPLYDSRDDDYSWYIRSETWRSREDLPEFLFNHLRSKYRIAGDWLAEYLSEDAAYEALFNSYRELTEQ